ncbi:MAG: homocysteine S-methyltransferase [bacterium]|nr:homocysteine S-methyltransferase [bacterium]
MPRYRHHLPQLNGDLFLTDGGLETTMIFEHGVDLPEFAAVVMLETTEGRALLRDYFQTYAGVAAVEGAGFILESVTWRASAAWGTKLGYDAARLDGLNRDAVALVTEVRREIENDLPHVVISGCMGPRGDGYEADGSMDAREAEAYHRFQIDSFAATEADMVTAFTMTSSAEATGLARAARAAGLPVVIGFTVETDGRLPSGESLNRAIETVDDATDRAPAYYMINCAHPTHFAAVLDRGPWIRRIRAVRANASVKSHAELDESTELDAGDSRLLGRECAALRKFLPNLNVFGGCCGTDHGHVAEMARAATG